MAEVETVQIESTNGDAVKTAEVKEEVKLDVKEEAKVEVKEEDKKIQTDLTRLELDIIRQIEYYFSENNLRRDKFLIQKVADNPEGWVDISVLLTFNRLKKITEDAAAIADAMDKSNKGYVQLSEDRSKLRRHPENALPEFNETRRKELQARTAYAKGFPLDTNITTLIDYFNNNFENVEQVNMRKYFDTKTKTHLFKGSVFVTFSDKESADNFVSKPELKFDPDGEKVLLRYSQSQYIEIKKKEREELDKKKKAKKGATKEGEPEKTDSFSLPKSAVVHFVGVEGEITREDIKSKVQELDETLDVAFIHFSKGDKDGDLRFNKENDGTKLIEKLEDGKVR